MQNKPATKLVGVGQARGTMDVHVCRSVLAQTAREA